MYSGDGCIKFSVVTISDIKRCFLENTVSPNKVTGFVWDDQVEEPCNSADYLSNDKSSVL